MRRSIVRALGIGLSLTLLSGSPPVKGDSAVGHEQHGSALAIRVETSASDTQKEADRCEAMQSDRADVFESWSTVGEERIGPSGALEAASSVVRCGAGPFPVSSIGASSEGGRAASDLILQLSATRRWDPGAMDPGPVPVVNLVLALTSRRLKGFAADGTALYGDAVKEHRSVRIGEGEEFDLPATIPSASGDGAAAAREVFLRIRAGASSREGAVEYGAVAVRDAAPGSEIRLDGGVADHAGTEGRTLLSNVPVGLREVGMLARSGARVTRLVTVVKGRTVVVSPMVADIACAGPFATPAGKNAQGYPQFRRARDGALMIRIPGGEFVMGNFETEGKPLPHTVSVSTFLMDELPVTVGQFSQFAAATGRPLPPEPYWGSHDDHPVAFVRWDEARAFCEWTGARLPTEAEREKAARGTDGRMFPWGNEPPSPERGVFRRNWGYEGNDRVGIRPAGASPYGLLDAGGNMWEWCQDWYDPDAYRSSPREDPTGPLTGRAHVVRGGSWDSRPTVLSASCRNWGYVGYREGDFGFRCAADLPWTDPFPPARPSPAPRTVESR